MLYGEEIHVLDAAAEGGSPVNMNHALGAVYTRNVLVPGVARAFGVRVTTAFNYNTQTAQGVLTLYRYPAGVAGNKVALGTLKLTDALAAQKVAQVDAVNMVTDVGAFPSPAPAKYNAGDQLVIEVTTQATGGTYLAGAFQPFILVHNRGESVANQPQLVDQTLPIVGS